MGVPRLHPHAKIKRDHARKRSVILLPERIVPLNASAAEIVTLIDGSRSVASILRTLQERHPNAPIETDVPLLLARLKNARVLAESGVSPVKSTTESLPQPLRTTARPLLPPEVLLAELTYRCPLRCGYCSNPIALDEWSEELDEEQWKHTLLEAEKLGVLHVHFSGGEPLLRKELEALVQTASSAGLYTNLITSARGLEARLDALTNAGLDHVQVSFQDTDEKAADLLAGTTVHQEKLRAARAVKERGLALSLNFVVHRGNIERTGEFIDLAEELGALRLELANTQFHGWALKNRDQLLPTREQLEASFALVQERRASLRTELEVLYVRPDYYEDEPKPCTDGWGHRFLICTPTGTLFPCAGAHELPLEFPSVRKGTSLAHAWFESDAFQAFRGDAWMQEPCRSCDRRFTDHGGCRCQAFALTHDLRATDPACKLSPKHALIEEARARIADNPPPEVLYRVRSKR